MTTAATTFPVFLCDQFFGISPYDVQQREKAGTPVTVDEAMAKVVTVPFSFKSQVVQATDAFVIPMCVTAYKVKADGTLEYWRCRWDSSG